MTKRITGEPDFIVVMGGIYAKIIAMNEFFMKLSRIDFFKKEKIKQKSLIFAWGLYDLANQSFALNIVSLYFVRWVTIEKQTSELFYSISFGFSMLLVACLAPFLGAASDLMRKHRFFLSFFTLLSIVFILSLGLTESVFWGLIFFAIANFGCQAAIIFYNALLINIAPHGKIGLVSGIGKMMGYCGAVLGLYLIRPLVLKSGYRAAFVPSGLLFLIFALPCMLFVKDKKSSQNLKLSFLLKKENILLPFKRIIKDAFDLTKFSDLRNFLKATFFCLCAVNIVIIFMSVYVTRVFGLNEGQIINLVLFSTIFAIIGSITAGYMSDRAGYKKSLAVIFSLWCFCLILGALARSMLFYWLIGPLVGVALGATWVVFRALAVKIVPPQKIGEMFGLFSFVGYLSAVVGALFWGGMLWFLSPLGTIGYRLALLSLVFFFLPGFIYLSRIELKSGNI
ncbi:MAG: MFS transporter [Candidatus Omnitrophota bacterium]